MVNIGDIIFSNSYAAYPDRNSRSNNCIYYRLKKVDSKAGANEKRLQRMEQKLDDMLKKQKSLDYTEALSIHQCFCT